MNYEIKDSGKRQKFVTGMQRDSSSKIRYDLLPIFMVKRFAQHLTNGAKKYAPRNWEKASTPEELSRAYASAFRHFIQWFEGEKDEDHASSLMFNISEVELIKNKLGKNWKEQLDDFRKREGEINND